MKKLNDKFYNLFEKYYPIVFKGVNVVLMFIASIWLAKLLGPVEFGKYTEFITVVGIISVPYSTGMSTFIIREYADKSNLNLKSLRFTVKHLPILIVTTFIVSKLWFDLFDNYFILLIVFAVINMILFNLFSAVYRALHKIQFSMFVESILRPVIFLMTIFVFFRNTNSSNDAFNYFLFSFLLGLLIFVFKSRNIIYTNDPFYCPSNNSRYSVLILLSYLQLLSNYTDVLFLSYFTSYEIVSSYKILTQFGSLLLIGLVAINQKIQPEARVLFRLNKITEIQALLKKSWLTINLFAVVLGIFLIIFFNDLIKIVFGEDFLIKDMEMTFRIYVLGIILNAFFGSGGMILNISGYERLTALSMFSSVLLNICLNLLLVPHYGMIGTAISFSASILLWNLIVSILVKRKLNLKTIGL